MTAEIAILNRTAVALAADSIVTFAGASGSKTYDSAEKIFELSHFRPIGLMVYNNSELAGMPVEIIVRDFRVKISDEFENLIDDVWHRFRRYLLDVNSDANPENSNNHFKTLIGEELEELQTKLVNFAVQRQSEKSDISSKEPKQYLVEIIDTAIERVSNDQIPDYLNDISQEKFIERFGDITTTLVEQKLGPLMQGITGEEMGENLKKKFHKLAFALMRSRKKSTAFTGLVFAGFGRSDTFSSLQSVEIDGIYFDQIREIKTDKVDIDRNGVTAEIVPFAQKDMPERFIFGIDQAFERKLGKIAEDLIMQVLGQATESFDQEQRERIKFGAIKRFAESIGSQKENSAKELQSVVNHLSKKELGEVAYSLVELTSRKRRYSSEMETVGGPIDVAILTRNEGFIWVRRKRYFDAELNPAYIERLRRNMRSLGGYDE